MLPLSLMVVVVDVVFPCVFFACFLLLSRTSREKCKRPVSLLHFLLLCSVSDDFSSGGGSVVVVVVGVLVGGSGKVIEEIFPISQFLFFLYSSFFYVRSFSLFSYISSAFLKIKSMNYG